MPKVITRQRYVKQSISLRPEQLDAARRIVVEERHGNLSRLFQELLDSEIARRRDVVTRESREMAMA